MSQAGLEVWGEPGGLPWARPPDHSRRKHHPHMSLVKLKHVARGVQHSCLCMQESLAQTRKINFSYLVELFVTL
jgi:hypothetical protein